MSGEAQQPKPHNILSLFTKFIHQNRPKSSTAEIDDEEISSISISTYRKMPNVVSFAVRPAVVVEPLKMECEQAAEKSTTPAVLWQVYALGSFLILRWIWARSKERKTGKGSCDERDPADTSQ